MAELLWKECADWLVRCKVLPSDHRVIWSTAQVIDLANTLRDGVLLCHLLNNLMPSCMDLKEISLRPQMSQFLCLKNIRMFITTCQRCFDLKQSDLFEPSVLFDFTDFGKVLNTLSKLSHCPKAAASGIRGFPCYKSTHDYYNDAIYRNLDDIANCNDESDYFYEAIGAINNGTAADEAGIYEDLCSLQKQDTEIPMLSQAPIEKRDYCIRELLETEKNYIEVLNRIMRHFIRPLKITLKEDSDIIFKHIKKLSEIHTGLQSEMAKSFNNRLSDCFLRWKDQFVIYGDYCSNLPIAQERIDELCSKNEAINQAILHCQKEYNEGKFKLRDLLSVPMQRILKYHLFLSELIKNTPETHEDYQGLHSALDAMRDISQYINEVKRDNETLQIIRDIQQHITDLIMPDNMELKDYGRLLIDGEVKMRDHLDGNKIKNRYIFVFDRLMLICKSMRSDQYSFKQALILHEYRVEDTPIMKGAGKDKWSYSWLLVHRSNKVAYTMQSKTDEQKKKWMEAIQNAMDNTVVDGKTDHNFVMHTFTAPTPCDSCHKLLRGIFYQGYRCQTCGSAVHKSCIANARSCGAPSLPPRPLLDSFRDQTDHWNLRSPKPDFLNTYVEDQRGNHMMINEDYRIPAIGMPPSQFNVKSSNYAYVNLKLEEYSWFAGKLDHDSSTSIIEKLPEGAFLVRISERQKGKFAITLKHDDKVKHMKVCNSDDGLYYLSESKYFKSIVELVRWYEEHSLVDCFIGLNVVLEKPYKIVMNCPDPIGYAVADYDFSATTQNMLSLRKGDRVAILSKRGGDKGWWKGRIHQRIGYFPLAYVTEEAF